MIEQAEASPQWKQQIADEIREKGWSEAGVQAFRRILDSGEPPQVLVSPNRLDALVPIEDSSPARTVALADERPPRRSLLIPCSTNASSKRRS